MSPIKRVPSAFSSAGDRSSRFPGGDMPLQNLKSLYAESPDLPIFTRAVSPCPLQLRQQNLRCPDFYPYYIHATRFCPSLYALGASGAAEISAYSRNTFTSVCPATLYGQRLSLSQLISNRSRNLRAMRSSQTYILPPTSTVVPKGSIGGQAIVSRRPQMFVPDAAMHESLSV